MTGFSASHVDAQSDEGAIFTRGHPANSGAVTPKDRILALLGVALLLGVLASGQLWRAYGERPVPPSRTATEKSARVTPGFAGSAACAKCHRAEYDRWWGSHHQLAMQPATDATVLGKFNDVTVRADRIAVTFLRRGSAFIVRTTGPDGVVHDYQIKFTFGVFPLQQYLIPMPSGRLQALGVAWDSRPSAAGGQRWLFLFPEVKPGAALFWTGIDQTWNFMCADCHSTNVRKNYDLHTRSYATTYSEIDVGCEACHGPGSDHIVWATRGKGWEQFAATEGLPVQYHERRATPWTVIPATGNARPKPQKRSWIESNTCARCHSRRSQIEEDHVHGQPVGDDYRVSVLDEGLYFSDGQIKAEDYEYGSFLQSRMYHSGVVCSDCHDPHNLKLRAEGNQVCYQCHSVQKYNSASHHHHKLDAAGSRCVECHMPTRTYMMVHERHDHSLRIPRPDLSVKLEVPNACNNCHKDKTAKWAAGALVRWYGRAPVSYQRFALALAAGADGAPGAAQALAKLGADKDQPSIARATAISGLSTYAGPDAADAVAAAVTDPSPLVRRAAASSVTAVAPSAAAGVLAPLLRDKVRDVRLEAAASAELTSLPIPRGIAGGGLNRAIAEYIEAQDFNTDRPEAHVNLGLLYEAENQSQRAIAELKLARDIDPTFAPAAVDLADLYRQLGRDADAGAVLADALRRSPQNAAVLHAMGLYLVRAKRRAEALHDLEHAARLAPENARFGYVYAVALQDAGESDAAISELQQVLKHHPYDRDSLAALVAICAGQGNRGQALAYATRLRELDPDNRPSQQEIDRLRAMPER
jgi:predicted CXXCH cytochrome family protein